MKWCLNYSEIKNVDPCDKCYYNATKLVRHYMNLFLKSNEKKVILKEINGIEIAVS